MNISKIIFFLVVCIVNANTHVWAQNDALKVYDLKGNPSMLRFRSFKLSLDSLTGKLKVGKKWIRFQRTLIESILLKVEKKLSGII